LVELTAADIRQIAPRADELIRLLDAERQSRVRALGASDEALRSLAAGLLLHDAFGEAASRGRFVRGEHGKPRLPDGRPFNLSHAGDYAVLALSDEPVGVDIERIRPLDAERFAARFFHPLERRFTAASADRSAAVFLIWTLKESYLKAEGQGLSVSPASFCILPNKDGSASLADGPQYRFRSFDAFPGYCLSVCSREREIASDIRMRSW